MRIELQEDCLASEYLKSAAALFAAMAGTLELAPVLDEDSNQRDVACRDQPCRVLCVGVGGGTFPMFLVHHFDTVNVDAVEIDPVVIEAAHVMGFPESHDRIHVHIEDAYKYLSRHVEEGREPYDVIYIDAFDGEDNVPGPLCTPQFANFVASALKADKGACIMNFHDTLKVKDQFMLFSDAIRQHYSRPGPSTSDQIRNYLGFYVSCKKQQNLLLCCSNAPVYSQLNSTSDAMQLIRCAASYVGNQQGYVFPSGQRSVADFSVCQDGRFPV